MTEIALYEKIPFTTKIYQAMLPDQSHLIEKVLELKDGSEGKALSNAGGWQSENYFDNDLPWMQPILDLITPCMQEVYQKMGLDRVKQSGYWFNINPRYSYNHQHSHPGAFFSAVLYLKAPKDSGYLMLHRPDLLREYIPEMKLTDDNWGMYFIEPQANMLVIFPAFLQHHVRQNLCMEEDHERISIAFNFR